VRLETLQKKKMHNTDGTDFFRNFVRLKSLQCLVYLRMSDSRFRVGGLGMGFGFRAEFR
jgi:hypothetical protein